MGCHHSKRKNDIIENEPDNEDYSMNDETIFVSVLDNNILPELSPVMSVPELSLPIDEEKVKNVKTENTFVDILERPLDTKMIRYERKQVVAEAMEENQERNRQEALWNQEVKEWKSTLAVSS